MSNAQTIVDVKRVKRPGGKKRIVNSIITLAIFAIILGASYFFLVPREKKFIIKDYKTEKVKISNIENSLSLIGTVEISNKDIALSPEDAICTQVYLKAGELVKKGDVILKLESRKLEDGLTKAENNLKIAQRQKLKNEQDLKRGLRDFNRQLNKQELEKEKILKDLEQARKLYDLNSITRVDLEKAEENLLSINNQITETNIKISDLTEDGKLQEELTNFDLQTINSDLENIRKKVNDLTLRSKIDGKILDIKVKQGDSIGNGGVLATIGDINSSYISIQIPVKYSESIIVGQKVNLKSDNIKFSGTISMVNSVVNTGSKGEKLLYGEILPDKQVELIPGSSVGSEIILSNQENQLTLPRGEYIISGKNRYVYVLKGDKAIKTEVEYGSVNSDTASFVKGLKNGDEVIVTSYNNFIDKDKVYIK